MNDTSARRRASAPAPFLQSFLVAVWTLAWLAGGSSAHAAGRVVITDLDGAGWGFTEEVSNGIGTFENGPAGVPRGTGGISLFVDATGRMLFGSQQLAGTRFADVTLLEYSTYRSLPAAGVVTVSLQFNVDYDLTDGDASWQGRLVFEPYYTEVVVSDGWQTWDPLTGLWWSSGAPGNALCPISSPCSWDTVLANWPESGIQQGELSGVLLKAGGPWPDGFFGFVDAFTIGIGGVDTVYDFETGSIFADGFESGDVSSWSTVAPAL